LQKLETKAFSQKLENKVFFSKALSGYKNSISQHNPKQSLTIGFQLRYLPFFVYGFDILCSS
jgi:hypothetical protein